MIVDALRCQGALTAPAQRQGALVKGESKQSRKDAIRRLREVNNNDSADDRNSEEINNRHAPLLDNGAVGNTPLLSDSRCGERKAKKFVPVPDFYCFEFTPRDSQDFENDLTFEQEELIFCGGDACLDDDMETQFPRGSGFDKRAKRKNKIRKARVQLTDKHYSTDKLFHTCGRKLYLKAWTQSGKEKRDRALTDAITLRKQNIDKDLVKRKLIRQGPTYPVFQQRSFPSVASPANGGQNSRKRGRNTQTPTNNGQQRPVHRYELTNDRISAEESYLAALVALQHREITPEDYEVLLRLEQQVAPKTVEKETLNSFKTDVVTPETSVTQDCAICMEKYQLGETRKHLPCGHVFHGKCIDTWLSNSSMKCPLDGLDVA